MVKNPPANAGDTGSTAGSGRSLGEGNGNPLQYSCLENPMGRGAWRATVHGVIRSQTQLSNQHLYSCNRRHGPGSRILNCKVKWSGELPFVATGGQQSPGTQTRGGTKGAQRKKHLVKVKGQVQGQRAWALERPGEREGRRQQTHRGSYLSIPRRG